LAAFDEAQIFFFPPFRLCFKKIFKVSALWEEIAQSFQTDTRAVVSQKKKTSLFFIIFTNSIALRVEHTKEEHVKEEAFRDQNRKREEKRERVSKPLLFPLNKTHTHTERERKRRKRFKIF